MAALVMEAPRHHRRRSPRHGRARRQGVQRIVP